MRKLLLLAAAALTVCGAAYAADLDTDSAPLLKRAEDAFDKKDYPAAIKDLNAVRDMAMKLAGADDTRTLHARGLLVRALTGAGQYEQAIAEGIGPLHAFSQPATKASIDGLYLRYYLADAFAKCTAPRCGDETHRIGNVDALMQAMLAGLSTYKKSDARVAALRSSFSQTCMQRYLPADCAAANGK
jgi:hypothetical protein